MAQTIDFTVIGQALYHRAHFEQKISKFLIDKTKIILQFTQPHLYYNNQLIPAALKFLRTSFFWRMAKFYQVKNSVYKRSLSPAFLSFSTSPYPVYVHMVKLNQPITNNVTITNIFEVDNSHYLAAHTKRT